MTGNKGGELGYRGVKKEYSFSSLLFLFILTQTDLTDEGEALLPTHILVPHVTKLPMPEDCTVEELRQLIPSYIQEIAAEN